MDNIVRKYEDLKVWQKSMLLVKEVYDLTDSFPKKEQYRLTDQLCRCSVSVPSNIAEGSGRRSTKDYLRFINIAYGSLMECETQIRIASDLGYCEPSKRDRLLLLTMEIAKMLNALHASLKNKLEQGGLSEGDAPKYQFLNTKYLSEEMEYKA